jgi:hypothetical protein
MKQFGLAQKKEKTARALRKQRKNRAKSKQYFVLPPPPLLNYDIRPLTCLFVNLFSSRIAEVRGTAKAKAGEAAKKK